MSHILDPFIDPSFYDKHTVCVCLPEHGCLWNHKSESYKNRQLRWKTLEHLRVLLSSHAPPHPLTGESGSSELPRAPGTQTLLLPSPSGRDQEQVQEPAHHLPAPVQDGEGGRAGRRLRASVEVLRAADVPEGLLGPGRPRRPAAAPLAAAGRHPAGWPRPPDWLRPHRPHPVLLRPLQRAGEMLLDRREGAPADRVLLR